MNICSINSSAKSWQQGFALAISMILLVVITMLSLTAMRSANLDTKIAVNHQHKLAAFQASDNATFYLLSYPKVEHRALNRPNVEGDYDTNTNVAANLDFIPYQTSSHAKADMYVTMRNSRSVAYKFSGYLLNAPAVIYQGDALGSVANTNAVAHTRMEAAIIID
jgi:hypothetical protein